MAVLRYSSPRQGTMFVDLDKEIIVIGRSKEVDLTLEDPMSSRRHCEVRKQSASAWVLVDLDSKNGTYVNGTPVSHWSLRDGDLITIGAATILFKLER